MPRRMTSVRCFAVLLLFLVGGPLRAQQPRPEVVRGRVVADSGGASVSGADVVVTMAPDRATQATKTDSAGRFEVRFAAGTGDYLVHVELIGWQPWRKRITRVGTDSVLTVDVRLAAKAIALAPLSVQAERPRPARLLGTETGLGAKEDVVVGVSAAVPPGLQGDLAAMASTIPGVNAVNGGVSVLGLPPSQNNATLNGMSFGGSDVPREARTWTRVATSSFDPARGGFSGAQVSVDLMPGNTFSSRRGHLTLDAPPLQYTDPVAARLGQRFTSFQGSLGGDGELVRDRYNYNVAAQASRRAEDATSLLNAGSDVLEPAGVAPDSAARFLQILSAAGVPAVAGALPDSRVTTSASLIARLDHTPAAQRSWAVTGYGKLTSADAPFSPIATPAHGGSSRSGRGMLQAEHSLYFARNHLNLLRSALSFGSDRTQPALRLPDGRVLVGSEFGADAGGFASLAFGGNASLDSELRSWTWETMDELQFYNRDSRHKVKLFASSRLDGYRQSSPANRLGTYNYMSLTDLAANRPSSYSRQLTAPDASGGLWSGVLALGDTWRSRKISLLYGARLEGNRYTATPAFNPSVLSAFGARNDVVPDRVHVSPRLGFSYNMSGQERRMMTTSPIVTRLIGNLGVIRGGIGEFRSLLVPTLLSDATVTTGLADATRRLLCVGPAVPAPDWRALAGGAAPPASCADGSSGFADAAPAVRLFDPAYDAARSWRANLGWSGVVHRVALTLDGIYSLNRAQPGVVDLNFAGSPRFTLGDEGRPVFVRPSSIVAATGAVSPLEARRSDAFGRVLSQRSDLHGSARQLTVTLSPGVAGLPGGWYAAGAYTLADARAQYRGFDGAAFGDPTLREAAPSDYDIRHQFQLQAGYSMRWLNVSLFGTLSSPRPFTPIVGGDVNGDGLGGDRAFVFDPTRAADPAVAAGMQSLLATSSSRIRNCLQHQLGQAAGRNSCRGSWASDVRAQVSIGNRFPGVGGRLSGTLNLVNLSAGLDQLLHGSGALHGWGTPALPDPVLYNVRGFDPVAQRFRYEVNPRFGATRPSATTFRAPMRLTLDFQLNLGKSIGQQQLERSLAPGRRLPANALKAMYERNVLDVYQNILAESDSLLLSKEQVQQLKGAQQRYRERMDSLWTDLASYVSALPEHYDGTAALKRQEATVDKGWEITWKEGPTIRGILSPLQMRMVPELVSMLLNAKTTPHIRIFIQRG